MERFTRKSIMATVGADANMITYVQRLLKSEKGQKHLFGNFPGVRRATVMQAHINGVRKILSVSEVAQKSAW